MKKVEYAPFKVSQATQTKNLKCRNCSLGHYSQVAVDLGYCLRCGNTDFKVSNHDREAIFPAAAPEARY